MITTMSKTRGLLCLPAFTLFQKNVSKVKDEMVRKCGAMVVVLPKLRRNNSVSVSY